MWYFIAVSSSALQQMAEQAGDWMSSHGIKFIRKHVVTKLELVAKGPPRVIRVEYKGTETQQVHTEEFNTVSDHNSDCMMHLL